MEKTSAQRAQLLLCEATPTSELDVPLAYDTPSSENTSLSRTDQFLSSMEVEQSPVGQTTPHRPALLLPEHSGSGPQPYPSPTSIADSQEELANQVPRCYRTMLTCEGDLCDYTFKRPCASPRATSSLSPPQKRRKMGEELVSPKESNTYSPIE